MAESATYREIPSQFARTCKLPTNGGDCACRSSYPVARFTAAADRSRRSCRRGRPVPTAHRAG